MTKKYDLTTLPQAYSIGIAYCMEEKCSSPHIILMDKNDVAFAQFVPTKEFLGDLQQAFKGQ